MMADQVPPVNLKILSKEVNNLILSKGGNIYDYLRLKLWDRVSVNPILSAVLQGPQGSTEAKGIKMKMPYEDETQIKSSAISIRETKLICQ